eukprot:jgi/Mesen1/6843/ME000351S05958
MSKQPKAGAELAPEQEPGPGGKGESPRVSETRVAGPLRAAAAIAMAVGLLSRLRWMHQLYPPQPGEVACFKSATAFVDHLTELLSPLLGGCPVLIPPLGVVRTHPPDLLAYLEVRRRPGALSVTMSCCCCARWLRQSLPTLLHAGKEPPGSQNGRHSTARRHLAPDL